MVGGRALSESTAGAGLGPQAPQPPVPPAPPFDRTPINVAPNPPGFSGGLDGGAYGNGGSYDDDDGGGTWKNDSPTYVSRRRLATNPSAANASRAASHFSRTAARVRSGVPLRRTLT